MTSNPGPDEPDGALRSPEVARWALSQRLRRRRHELEITVGRITQHLGLTRSRWSQIENDLHMIAPAMIPQLAELFEFDAETTRDLQALRSAASTRRGAWWLDYTDVLTPDVRRYCGFEHGASSIRTFGSTLINGLLQVPEYAYQLIANNPHVSEFDRKRVLEVRLHRQKRLFESPRLRMHAIIYEAALLADLGSPHLLRDQLRHVVRLIDELEESLQVLVLPFSSEPTGLTGGSTVHLLDFTRPELGTVIWDEALLGRLQADDDKLADLLALMYQHASERSYDRQQSREFILEKARTLDKSQ